MIYRNKENSLSKTKPWKVIDLKEREIKLDNLDREKGIKIGPIEFNKNWST